MDTIDGYISKDKVYRILSDFRAEIPIEIRKQITEKVKNSTGVEDAWINVNDLIPEKSRYVLLFVQKSHSIIIGYLEYDGNGYSDGEFWYELAEITHWMPLPEPPKEGE